MGLSQAFRAAFRQPNLSEDVAALPRLLIDKSVWIPIGLALATVVLLVAVGPLSLVHTLVTTHAGASEIKQLPKLLHGQERALYGDQAYWSEMHRVAAKAHRVRYRVNRRAPNASKPLSEYQRRINRLRSSTRARGEHAFRIVKQLWGFTKVRYRGLAKNTARLFTMFALANLYMVRRRLLAS